MVKSPQHRSKIDRRPLQQGGKRLIFCRWKDDVGESWIQCRKNLILQTFFLEASELETYRKNLVT